MKHEWLLPLAVPQVTQNVIALTLSGANCIMAECHRPLHVVSSINVNYVLIVAMHIISSVTEKNFLTVGIVQLLRTRWLGASRSAVLLHQIGRNSSRVCVRASEHQESLISSGPYVCWRCTIHMLWLIDYWHHFLRCLTFVYCLYKFFDNLRGFIFVWKFLYTGVIKAFVL
jgi:hypothetical protein